MDDPHLELRTELIEAGFYVPATENMGRWRRIIACSQGPPEFEFFGGRSFWIALVDEQIYIGVWGSYVYTMPNRMRVMDLCHKFLTATGLTSDFGADLISSFQPIAVDKSVCDEFLPDERPEN